MKTASLIEQKINPFAAHRIYWTVSEMSCRTV